MINSAHLLRVAPYLAASIRRGHLPLATTQVEDSTQKLTISLHRPHMNLVSQADSLAAAPLSHHKVKPRLSRLPLCLHRSSTLHFSHLNKQNLLPIQLNNSCVSRDSIAVATKM